MMGMTKHEAVIGLLGSTDHEAINQIIALRDQSQVSRQLLLGPAEYFNGVVSFALLPDGANEGSPPSNEVEEIRRAFIRILRNHGRHWAHIILKDEAATPPIYEPRIVESGGYGMF
jgi:hypothetical protein